MKIKREKLNVWGDNFYGIEWEGRFLPFKNQNISDESEYVIIEHPRTNDYGFYENGSSQYNLFFGSLNAAETHFDHNCICGIVNAIASFRVRKNRISKFKKLDMCIVRKQG